MIFPTENSNDKRAKESSFPLTFLSNTEGNNDSISNDHATKASGGLYGTMVEQKSSDASP
jgi:hypothetical protein